MILNYIIVVRIRVCTESLDFKKVILILNEK